MIKISLSSVKVTVAYLGQAREAAGSKEDAFELPSPAHIELAFSRAVKTHPGLEAIKKNIRLLLNGQWASDNAELKDGDRVTLLPPSGGG
ncbi:MAG TPA: MoaD/ThiS family protein [Terriglobales bacterium]|nr:MoaD/ThiS family protein [Terriglobales bacterium]